MSNLLSELEAVLALDEAAEQKSYYDGIDAREGRDDAAVNFLRTHHAEIAAAVRDAARWRYVVGNSEWIRDEEDTLMAVRFEYSHPNLESIGMRTYAIDAAMSAREGQG